MAAPCPQERAGRPTSAAASPVQHLVRESFVLCPGVQPCDHQPPVAVYVCSSVASAIASAPQQHVASVPYRTAQLWNTCNPGCSQNRPSLDCSGGARLPLTTSLSLQVAGGPSSTPSGQQVLDVDSCLDSSVLDSSFLTFPGLRAEVGAPQGPWLSWVGPAASGQPRV